MDRTMETYIKPTTTDKEILNWMGELAIIHVSGKETGGRFSLVELYATREGEVPLHVHHNEDEGFYIIEGEMTFYIGDRTVKGKAGDFVFAPKDMPHRYTVDNPGHARVLMTFSPAGFEGFVRATSEPATSMTPPPVEEIVIDLEKIAALAAEYGTEFIDSGE
jgi:mannose-6-phosphate isomerase-like protein (cupin superfamily)